MLRGINKIFSFEFQIFRLLDLIKRMRLSINILAKRKVVRNVHVRNVPNMRIVAMKLVIEAGSALVQRHLVCFLVLNSSLFEPLLMMGSKQSKRKRVK